MPVTGVALAAALAERGTSLPAGHALVTLAERPDLTERVERSGSSVWPKFMLHDIVSGRHWHRLAGDFPSFQLGLFDAEGVAVAVARGAPLTWDGTPADLPRGWDRQFERSVDELERGLTPDTLGAIMIVTDPARRGDRLGGLMVQAMQARARLEGLRALIACVRPTLLERYPLIPIAEYARWTRDDGLPFDPWIRIHVRLGGRLSRPEPQSMCVAASIEEWEAWTGMAFPASGQHVVAGACAPVTIDLGADVGTYDDPNVWIVHDLTVDGPLEQVRTESLADLAAGLDLGSGGILPSRESANER